jgi:hypothetical protein
MFASSNKDSPLTVGQFLNKLPQSVVRDGKLINIRNDLSTLINVENVYFKIDKSFI